MNDLDKVARETCGRAAAYISEHGWNQGSLYSGRWSYETPAPACAIGAIFASTPRNQPNFLDVQRRATELVALAVGGPPVDDAPGLTVGWGWNDHPSTTQEDVILTLKRVANND